MGVGRISPFSLFKPMPHAPWLMPGFRPSLTLCGATGKLPISARINNLALIFDQTRSL
jgi:hypothetical protein